jgi:hypothetical protein
MLCEVVLQAIPASGVVDIAIGLGELGEGENETGFKHERQGIRVFLGHGRRIGSLLECITVWPMGSHEVVKACTSRLESNLGIILA